MPENQNIEWKLSWRNEYLKWVCGFANASGGTIFIGKNDEGITLNKRQTEALSYWKENGEILSSLYALKFNINSRTALRDLKELVEKGLLIKEGGLKNSRYLFP